MLTNYNKHYSSSVSSLSTQQVYELLQNKLVHPHCSPSSSEKYVIVDVRDEDEYSSGHIVNSVNIPHEIFLENQEKQLNSFLKQFGGQNYSLIFHCFYSSQRGPSSALAFATYLEDTEQEHLFTHLFVMKGGWNHFLSQYKGDSTVVKE